MVITSANHSFKEKKEEKKNVRQRRYLPSFLIPVNHRNSALTRLRAESTHQLQLHAKVVTRTNLKCSM